MTAEVTIPVENPRHARVRKIAGIHGWSMIIVSGLAALISLLFLDVSGAVTGFLIVLAGWMELKGRARLRRSDVIGARKWLTRSQLWFFTVVVVYSLMHLIGFDAEYLRGEVLPNVKDMLSNFGIDLNLTLRNAGMTVDQLLSLVKKGFYAGWISIIVLTGAYLAVMQWYYRRNLSDNS